MNETKNSQWDSDLHQRTTVTLSMGLGQFIFWDMAKETLFVSRSYRIHHLTWDLVDRSKRQTVLSMQTRIWKYRSDFVVFIIPYICSNTRQISTFKNQFFYKSVRANRTLLVQLLSIGEKVFENEVLEENRILLSHILVIGEKLDTAVEYTCFCAIYKVAFKSHTTY